VNYNNINNNNKKKKKKKKFNTFLLILQTILIKLKHKRNCLNWISNTN